MATVRTLADEGLDEGDRQLLRDLDSHGFHIAQIPEEDGSPGWAFSIGLHDRLKHPEVAVFGLSLELNASIVSEVGKRVRAGETFTTEGRYEGLVEGVSCVFRPLDPAWYRDFLGYARWFYRGNEFPALQCIWPDLEGRLPWESGYSPPLDRPQPLLFETDRETARVEAFLPEDED